MTSPTVWLAAPLSPSRINFRLGLFTVLSDVLPIAARQHARLVEEGRALPHWLRQCRVPLRSVDIGLLQQGQLTVFLPPHGPDQLPKETVSCRGCRRSRPPVCFVPDNFHSGSGGHRSPQLPPNLKCLAPLLEAMRDDYEAALNPPQHVRSVKVCIAGELGAMETLGKSKID